MTAALILDESELRILWQCINTEMIHKDHTTAYELKIKDMQNKIALAGQINAERTVPFQSQYTNEELDGLGFIKPT